MGTEPAVATGDERVERARAEAREAVHGRLVLLSCAIWTLGTFLLIWVAPDDGWIAFGAVAFLLPAGLIWLARERLVTAETERRLRAASGPRDA
jgi:hypothetical protein